MAGYSCSWGWKGEVITSLRKHSKKKNLKKKKNGQVARTRLAQGPGAGIVSGRLHDSTFIRTAASTW